MSISRHQAVGAYRRWEPPAFDAGAQAEPAEATPAQAAEAPPAPAPEPPASPEPMIKLPTAEEIEAMFEDARREGQSVGYAEGLERGSRETAAQAARLAGIANGFEQALAQIDGEVAEEIVTLAVEIARQVVRHTLADHPSAIAETVRAALHQLPQNQLGIQLHPEDATLVREQLGDQLEHGRHQIIEDDSLSRGGCRIRAMNCEIDATLETRWRRVLETIGRGDAPWETPAP